ncbi:60 kDa inner membrane insertion protein [Thioalkalivibrio sp. K90mix]|jgi:hypothetical protein|uniref:hypothetical protein n=1 Tax=Thioalkalivibrio sp. (strain K90mix) TaxID=396595 RepID=UPI000195A8B4|nr:hypothetical protein [Thioalkalivibrio sp. K90mix]ADC71493.1 60 kDa inner membrane insertion protein [Thioalkalivibrio sp. K90mix]
MRWLVALLLLANLALFGWSWQQGHWNGDPYADVPPPERGTQTLDEGDMRIRPLDAGD